MESTQKTNPLNTINDDECRNGIYNVDIIIEVANDFMDYINSIKILSELKCPIKK